MNKHQIRAVLFDCDGVVIDSGNDIADAVNAAMEHFGYKTVPVEKLISFVGDGVRNLVVRALAWSKKLASPDELEISETELSGFMAWYVNYYNEHAVVKTTLYPGFEDAIKALHENGIRMGIVTNKPTNILMSILNHFGIAEYFDAPVGSDDVKKLKPDPEGLVTALERINAKITSMGLAPVTPGETVMAGDSATDIMAGKAFGAFTCGIKHGIGNTEKMLSAGPDITAGIAAEACNAIILANKITAGIQQ